MFHNINSSNISSSVNGYLEKREYDQLQKPTSSKFFRPWNAQENETTTTTTSTESLMTHQNKHTECTAHKVEEMIIRPTVSNNMTSMPSTTAIPPTSMEAIQQSMRKAEPLLLAPPLTPYGERMSMDMIPFYSQPLYMDAARNILPYPTFYNPANPYMYNMPYQQHQYGAQLIPAPPGYAHNVVHSPPFPPLSRNQIADHYYQPSVSTNWFNVPYTNSLAAQYPTSTQVYPAAIQQNMYKRIQPDPSSVPLPRTMQCIADKSTTAALSKPQSWPTNILPENDSTYWNWQAAQQNMFTTTSCPELQTPSTSAQVANERKNVKTTKARRTKQATQKPVVPLSAPAVLPTSTKTNANSTITNLLQEEKPTSSGTTKRKCVDVVQEDETAKKLKIALEVDKILPYRPNMARKRPKKAETREQRIAREQNTIACRKYRRLRKIAKLIEQKLEEAEAANEIAKNL